MPINGIMKAITFSYDDGVLQDKRLIEILNKYNLKCTFNLNSGYFGKSGMLIREDVSVAHCKARAKEIRGIYEGHEIAVHTLHHPWMAKLPSWKIVKETEEDRLYLSDIAGYEVVGMAYPAGTPAISKRVSDLVEKYTGIEYARLTDSTLGFEAQTNLFRFNPTVHHTEWKEMYAAAEKFLEMKAETPQLFYIWGHSYEFDIDNSWQKFEDFCKLISGRSDITYCTNKEALCSGNRKTWKEYSPILTKYMDYDLAKMKLSQGFKK